MLGAAKALAARLASLPLQAVMATKKLLRSHAAPAVKAALAAEAKEFQRLMKSAEAQERFRAFQQRVRTA
ncbi:enoyl-CoA hydratase [compost metagenome]